MNVFIFWIWDVNQETAELTEKAQQTRQHILDTALSLFAAKGYDDTTMRDIANAAECSLGLTYRYFSRKEELVLGLYWQMAADTLAEIDQLPRDTIAANFYRLMLNRLQQAEVYRDSFQALAAAAMNPKSGVDILGSQASGMREQVRKSFLTLVQNASDAPPEAQADDLAMLLYAAHFAIILFWLYDRSQGATFQLLALLRGVIGWTRRLLRVPFAADALKRGANILLEFFEGRSYPQ